MANKKFILSIDQGTSSTKTLIFDASGKSIAKGLEPLHTSYAENGFVEQDPEDVYQNVLTSIQKCLQQFHSLGFSTNDIESIGISNQRETFLVWDHQGKPLHPAIVWQCKRSISICETLKQQGLEELVNQKTGLVIDPYFSATKLIWLFQNNETIKKAIQNGAAFLGTIDTWLLYKLTNGLAYATDYTNASRTMLFNLQTLNWDHELINLFGLKGIQLPTVKPSSSSYGVTNLGGLLDHSIPIGALIGDSHAAAFGEGCFTAGTAKATLGTGCSILMHIGNERAISNNGMISTICWSTEDCVAYALEGVIVTCGATIEWLKNELGLFAESKETEAMASSLNDNAGVYLVPAFSGLGAPHWDMNRKASIVGLSFGTGKKHIVRAALESIPYQIKDVLDAMESDTSIRLERLMVDGGITANQFLIQFLADLIETSVVNIGTADVSALGAAYMAGLQSGLYKSLEHLQSLNSTQITYQPTSNSKAIASYQGWQEAIKRN